jgi:hypothetical protein
MMEEISLRISLTEKGSITPKRWKYFKHYSLNMNLLARKI